MYFITVNTLFSRGKIVIRLFHSCMDTIGFLERKKGKYRVNVNVNIVFLCVVADYATSIYCVVSVLYSVCKQTFDLSGKSPFA